MTRKRTYGDLTQRECGIVYLVACGWEGPRIAAYFKVPLQNIKNTLTSIYRKTRARNNAHLAYWWVKSDKIQVNQKEI